MSSPPIRRVVTIPNEQGFHARPASVFAKTAMQFESRVAVIRSDRTVDGKSIIDLLTMGATQGTELIIEAEGQDAAEAAETLAALVESGFHMEDELKTESKTSPRQHDELDESP